MEKVVFETPPGEEIPETPEAPASFNDVIFSAMNNNHKLSISYLKKSTGETVERIVQPYSFRKDPNGLIYFYVFDETNPTADIKSLIYANVVNAQELQDTFSPRVMVEPMSIFDPPPIGTASMPVGPIIQPIQAEPEVPKTGQFVVFEEPVE